MIEKLDTNIEILDLDDEETNYEVNLPYPLEEDTEQP